MLNYKIGDILIDTLNPYYNNTGKSIILNQNTENELKYESCYNLNKCKCEIVEIYTTDITVTYRLFLKKFPITKNKRGVKTKPIDNWDIVRVWDKTQDRVHQEFIKRFKNE